MFYGLLVVCITGTLGNWFKTVLETGCLSVDQEVSQLKALLIIRSGKCQCLLDHILTYLGTFR
jgi:hypothetical protein